MNQKKDNRTYAIQDVNCKEHSLWRGALKTTTTSEDRNEKK